MKFVWINTYKMKNHIIIACLLSVFSANAQYNLKNITFSNYVKLEQESGNYQISDQQAQQTEEMKNTFKNLRLYMLKGNAEIRKVSKDLGKYLSLQDAVTKGRIKITELNGGSVNTLQFENIGKDTIMVLAGEIVTGGKQDRVVGKDILLPPNSGKVEVPVFCVEHGRWTPNGNGESFKGYFGVSSAAVRKQAVVDKNQSGVWKNVAEMNAKNKVNPSTGTYTALKNADSLNLEIDEYLKFFQSIVYSDSNNLGFVAVTGDSIISCDLFASNSLFKSHANDLLKAAAVEASTNGSAVKIAASTVLAFLAEFLASEVNQDAKIREKGELLKSGNSKVHLNYYKTGKSAIEMPHSFPNIRH
jgi:hypothetical protein